jgi:hypothetical protein
MKNLFKSQLRENVLFLWGGGGAGEKLDLLLRGRKTV